MPQELAALSNMKYLYLGGNALSGTILTELGLLTNLVEFYIESNFVSGTIPSIFW
jgi:LRR receptor-like serine/threonine-protein kinase FLS2